jgi:4-hydroxy-tetrahydrodipicolinate reductase
MRILLIGYGKMGSTIEATAKARDHQIVGRIHHENLHELADFNSSNTDVAIEFTQPGASFSNICYCFEQGIPVVSGTTGWLDQKPEADRLCKAHGGAFFYASNFSIGVNLFFQINAYVARLMQRFPEYSVNIDEIHHTQKLDRPSGTAITLAEDIIQENKAVSRWVNDLSDNPEELVIHSFREEGVVGTHTIHYASEIDAIELKHTAHSREGFATGAVLAAEWLIGRKGVFGMQDLLTTAHE